MSKDITIPVYTETALNILNAAFTFYRRIHPSSLFRHCNDPAFNVDKSPEGQVVFRTVRSSADVINLFARAVHELIIDGYFMDPAKVDVVTPCSMDVPREDRINRKSQTEVCTNVILNLGNYRNRTHRHVKFKLTDAWLLREFLHDKCSAKNLPKIGFTAEQIDKVIGTPKNPLQVECIKVRIEEENKIKRKYDDLIGKKNFDIEQQIRTLRQELENYRCQQRNLMNDELNALKTVFAETGVQA